MSGDCCLSDFICKEVYIPLSSFRLVPCSYCWILIKWESIFSRFSGYAVVRLWVGGSDSTKRNESVCMNACILDAFSLKHNPHSLRALYQLLNASLCAGDRSPLSHSIVNSMKYTFHSFSFSFLLLSTFVPIRKCNHIVLK